MRRTRVETMTIVVKLQLAQLQVLSLNLKLDLEFFKVVLGWENIINLPSFSLSKADGRGWAMLNRELLKCYMVKEVVVANRYLVAVQKERGSGVAVGEGTTQAQATTQALVLAHQGSYASKEQMKQLIVALSKKQSLVKLPNFKQFHVQ